METVAAVAASLAVTAAVPAMPVGGITARLAARAEGLAGFGAVHVVAQIQPPADHAAVAARSGRTDSYSLSFASLAKCARHMRA